jgi:hypothetical protein
VGPSRSGHPIYETTETDRAPQAVPCLFRMKKRNCCCCLSGCSTAQRWQGDGNRLTPGDPAGRGTAAKQAAPIADSAQRAAGGTAIQTRNLLALRCLTGAAGPEEMLWRGLSVQPTTDMPMQKQAPSPATQALCARQSTRRSQPQRWRDAVATLLTVQRECEAQLQDLPDHLQDSAAADALQAICDLDLSGLEDIEPPRRFRD